MKIRIKFTKTGSLRFIGHLDVMRYFQKAFRRSEVDIAYSKGFSPHQLISFAAPLGIGLTSEGEYLDAEFRRVFDTKTMIEKINRSMVEEIQVLDFRLLPEEADNAMSSVAAADYLIDFREGYTMPCDFLGHISEFLAEEEIKILKKSKKSEQMVNIRPFIYEMKQQEQKIFLKVSTGSVDNLKPNLVMEAFCNFLDKEFSDFAFTYHRLETYMRNKNQELVPLAEAGSVITEPELVDMEMTKAEEAEIADRKMAKAEEAEPADRKMTKAEEVKPADMEMTKADEADSTLE